MPFLSVKDLTYAYPGQETPALRGANLSAECGEMVAVVGPNAAGKSTLARLIKGLLAPQRGAVLVGGSASLQAGPDRRVGLVFSNPENAIVSSLVEEDVAFGLEMLATEPAAIRERVDRVMESLGIAALRRRMPHRLSGGEQQMVALAGVLAAGPEILVLDEPTAFIDPPGRLRVMAALKRLCQEGRTIVLVTHDMEQAAQCSRVAVLLDGATVMQDSPERVFADSGLLATARLRPPFDVLLRRALHRSGKPIGAVLPPSADLVGWIAEGVCAGGLGRSASTEPAETQPPPPDILGYKDIRFGYATGEPARLLSDVSLGVVEGALTVLCGPNGSGKSTLLQMANGLLVPDSGEVLYRREALTALRKRPGGVAARIGMLFQSPERQVFAETVFDDVAFGPRNLGLGEGEVGRAVSQAMERVDLPASLLGRSPWTLSGGQLRRLAVAGVLAMRSEVLAMDEPTDGLDPAGAEALWAMLLDLTRTGGVSVLAATHQVPDDLTPVTRLALLEHGTIVQCGTPRSIVRAAGPSLLSLAPPFIRAQAMLMDRGLPLARPGLSGPDAVEAIVDALPQMW